jgi:predicted TIM-barrel fold metal-dependent hydrolase
MAKYKKIDMHILAQGHDRNMDGYLEKMDKGNVACAIVHGIPAYVHIEVSNFDPGDENAWVLSVVKRHKNRLLGSAYIDLTKPIKKCIAETEKYMKEGFIGVKIYPQYGYNGNDRKFDPYWDYLEKNNLICFIDCGWLLASKKDPSKRLQTNLSSPFCFEVPARTHPALRFELVHFGGGITYLETITMISRHPNVFADTSPGFGRWPFENDMPGMKNMDRKKVMLASNGAIYPYDEDEKFYIEKLGNIGYSEKDLEDFFYNNAAKLLKL